MHIITISQFHQCGEWWKIQWTWPPKFSWIMFDLRLQVYWLIAALNSLKKIIVSHTVLTKKLIRLQPWVPGTILVLPCPYVNVMWQYNIIILALFHFHKKSHTALCMIPWLLSNSWFILSKKKLRCLGTYEKINWITMDAWCN